MKRSLLRTGQSKEKKEGKRLPPRKIPTRERMFVFQSIFPHFHPNFPHKPHRHHSICINSHTKCTFHRKIHKFSHFFLRQLTKQSYSAFDIRPYSTIIYRQLSRTTDNRRMERYNLLHHFHPSLSLAIIFLHPLSPYSR